MDELGIGTGQNIRYEYFLVQFYNEMGCGEVESFCEIPEQAREVLAYMDYRNIVEPMIARNLKAGLSIRFCVRRYGVTHWTVWSIKEKYGIESK